MYVGKITRIVPLFEDCYVGRQLKFLVLTDPFGKVVAVLDTSSRYYLAPLTDPIMLISLAQIGIASALP